MSTDEIRHEVIEALLEVAPEADPGALDPSAPLSEQLDIDSMDFLAFLTGIAARTGVEVPEADYELVQSLEGCTAYVATASARA
jgi:acyl carrier protein